MSASLPADSSSSSAPQSGGRRRSPRDGGPSVLDLVRLSPEPILPPGGEELYRQIARLTDLQPGQDVLDAACGRGVSTAFLGENYDIDAHGVDPDPALIDQAEGFARARSLEANLHFQCAPLDDLPYKDGIFDVCIGEVGLGFSTDPARAVRELVRVTKPLGFVVLVELVWTGSIDESRREILVRHLGARPLLLVEWKQLLRDAGVVDLHVEDWSDQSSPFRPSRGAPFHDLARIFSMRQKVSILRRALNRWGWRGLRGAILREQEIHRLLTRQRVLGLSLIRGSKWNAEPPQGSSEAVPGAE